MATPTETLSQATTIQAISSTFPLLKPQPAIVVEKTPDCGRKLISKWFKRPSEPSEYDFPEKLAEEGRVEDTSTKKSTRRFKLRRCELCRCELFGEDWQETWTINGLLLIFGGVGLYLLWRLFVQSEFI
ncbi:predicted protein [Uncinocarpus reesii 1704]|uniref:Uncharacterized protein n=1 Tax=Uncinocarpus reesii (strain UAMH 1704) TaxID=336963 RepID=C4JX68_UNCRE|nr:uncharacterized protein UREG_06241 [Uncinocarpus reesii 1704]EEP81376.1 predicted protein [Uncinocarpus reesii 1704]